MPPAFNPGGDSDVEVGGVKVIGVEVAEFGPDKPLVVSKNRHESHPRLEIVVDLDDLCAAIK